MTDVPQHAFDDAAQVLHCALSGDSDAVVGTFDAVVDRSGVVTGVATPVHRGRTAVTYEIVITDDSGGRVCTARLTCQLVDPR